jgi:hypothetical protein
MSTQMNRKRVPPKIPNLFSGRHHAPAIKPLNFHDAYGVYTACGLRFTDTYAAGGLWLGTSSGDYIVPEDAADCPDCLTAVSSERAPKSP